MADFHRKLPYLVCPKKPEEFSEDDKQSEEHWLKRRDERRKAYSPSNWAHYFLSCEEVKIRNGDSLGLWLSSSKPEKSDNNGVGELNADGKESPLPFVLLLHGGGYSGLTWAPLVDELSRLVVADYGALDLRGHGESQCKNEDELDLQTLTQDILDALKWMQESETVNLGKRPLILVGHSMGGALGVNVSSVVQESNEYDLNLAGLVVLDVVEGSAMQALTSMQFFLRSRPQEFKSLSEAIQWCTRSGQTKNLDSARISMTGQLKAKTSGDLATQFVNGGEVVESRDNKITTLRKKRVWAKSVEEGRNSFRDCPPPSVLQESFVWRIDLSKTEPHWRGWFDGLSKKFLSVRCPKLLMLAGVDRLDKELTVGQMQGKFQMQVFHQVGHAVHEDAPDKAADCVASFLQRQRLVQTKVKLRGALPGC